MTTTTPSPAVVRLEDRVATLSTDRLVSIVETIEDQDTRSDEERIVYAIACTTLCRRLGVEPRQVLSSAVGPAAYLGLLATLAA